MSEERLAAYWKKNTLLIGGLLTLWAFVSYGCSILLARPLAAFKVGQLPMGFWFAQQGSLLFFIGIVLAYCLLMDVLDKAYDVHE